MHMADALLSPTVGSIMSAVSVSSVIYAATKIKKDNFDEKTIPLMGVMGAFVFSAQMINFTIPVTGSSGHIGGGILLAALLGQFPAFLTITAVLIIQSLFFADGGLLALGCNIFNMGFLTCFVAYPLIFKPLTNKMNTKNLSIASIIAVVVGLQLGAFGVVCQTSLSGITSLPFGTFLLLMQPIHLAIGLVEGLVTAAVLAFVFNARPETFDASREKKSMSYKKLLLILLLTAIVLGVCVSIFASSYPDGLEWAIEKAAGSAELEAGSAIHKSAENIQNSTAFLPDYGIKGSESSIGTSLSGFIGSIITLILAVIIGFTITFVNKRKKIR